MDVIGFAMKMELDGKNFYEKRAGEAADGELKKILLTLAEEEERHFQYFKSLRDDPAKPPIKDFSRPETLNEVQNIFEEMSRNSNHKPFGDDVISVWTEALRIEEKAHAFYKEQAGQETDRNRKSLLLKIAEEEYRHILMIDGVLTYLKQPETFADSAQFKNFRSLEGL